MACVWYVLGNLTPTLTLTPTRTRTRTRTPTRTLTLTLTLTPTLFKVENALKSSKYTALPMVYATSSMSYAIALICPNVPNLKALAASLGVDQSDVGAMCANKDVLAAVLKDVKETCAAAKLAKFEIPAKVILIKDEP